MSSILNPPRFVVEAGFIKGYYVVDRVSLQAARQAQEKYGLKPAYPIRFCH